MNLMKLASNSNAFFSVSAHYFNHVLQIKDSVVGGIPFASTDISPSPSPIMCATSPLPLSSTTSPSDISLSSSSTRHECATSGLPDLTSESCDENSDDRNTTSSSQEARSEPEDLESVQLGEGTSSGDTAASQSVNAGYKIVFDNIDKDVKPRHMTSDNQTRSLHYVQSYAVKDRVNYDCLSGERRTKVCIFDILPTKEDYDILKKNFAVLVSRVMVKFIPYFTSDYKELPTKHIPHEHSKEMATKSDIVRLYFN